jgi:hypothetical protein
VTKVSTNLQKSGRWGSKAASIVQSFGLIGIIFSFQILFGYEISLFPLYLLPVAKLAWDFGPVGAFVAVITATACWVVSSVFSGQAYSSEWMRYYNGCVRGAVFGVTAWTLLVFKATVEQHRRRMEAMRRMLNVCHGCGALQGSDGRWIPFEELTEKAPPSQSCECPACTAAAARAETRNPFKK